MRIICIFVLLITSMWFGLELLDTRADLQHTRNELKSADITAQHQVIIATQKMEAAQYAAKVAMATQDFYLECLRINSTGTTQEVIQNKISSSKVLLKKSKRGGS